MALPALLALTLAAFRQVGNNDFINFDDPRYVTENPHVRKGLTWSEVRWAFSSDYASNRHPLTWISHMLDVRLFGLNPGRHHQVSLLFHLLNTVLLFLVLWGMTGFWWRSIFVAALFALHPLHVESVAWAAERKDVLSTFFWFLTMGAYLRYARNPRISRFPPVVAALALGLAAKPMLVSLPLVLLALDYWPLGRGLGLIREKIPLLLLAAASGVVTYIVQKTSGAVASPLFYPFFSRFKNALISLLGYIGKMFLPHPLSVYYPYPTGGISVAVAASAGSALLLLTIAVYHRRRRSPYLALGWTWYLVTVLPVIGLVQVGAQAMADRYTYIPLTGLFIGSVWAISDISSRWRHRTVLLSVSAAVALAALSVGTHRRVAVWKDTETLFTQALEADPGNYIAHVSLGVVHSRRDQLEEALAHFTEALRTDPRYAGIHNNIGNVLYKKGDYPGAVAAYRRAIMLDPDFADAYFNLGTLLADRKDFEGAAAQLTRAIKIMPDHARAHNNLGLVYEQMGRLEEAAGHFRDSLRIDPDFAEGHNNLGVILARQGKPDDAGVHFQEALRLAPDFTEARWNLERAVGIRRPPSLAETPGARAQGEEK